MSTAGAADKNYKLRALIKAVLHGFDDVCLDIDYRGKSGDDHLRVQPHELLHDARAVKVKDGTVLYLISGRDYKGSRNHFPLHLSRAQ